MLLTRPYMHVLTEGINHWDLRCTLNYLINILKVFTLDFLNEKIKNFDYPTHDKTDIPNQIETKHLLSTSTGFTQTSGQMSTLFHNLPLMIGYLFDKKNEHWLNFLRLVTINNIIYCFVYNQRTIDELRQIIHDYLENLKKLYPSVNFIPKMHFLAVVGTQ